MTKRALFLILLGVLCASTALAAQSKPLVYSLNGKVAMGEFNAGILLSDDSIGYVDLYFSPEPLDNGTWGYYVDIYWNDGSKHEIYGLVSPGAIKPMAVWGPIQVNITLDSFIEPGGDYKDFSSLVGTLTLFTGPGSDNIVQTGNSTEVFSRKDGSTLTITFKGVRTEQDATFEGMFGATSGSYTLSVEGPYPDADMQVLAGTFRAIETPPTEE